MCGNISFSVELIKKLFSVDMVVDEKGRNKFELGGIGFIIDPIDKEFIVLKRVDKDFFKDYKMPYPSTFTDFVLYCRICGIEFFTLGVRE